METKTPVPNPKGSKEGATCVCVKEDNHKSIIYEVPIYKAEMLTKSWSFIVFWDENVRLVKLSSHPLYVSVGSVLTL